MSWYKMVCVGPKPGIAQATDQWSNPVSFWYPEVPGWVSHQRWEDIQRFQSPWPPLDRGLSTEEMLKQATVECRTRLQLSGGYTLWEMNLPLAPGSEEWIRCTIRCAEQDLVRWSKFDRFVRYPLSVVHAKLRNWWYR